MLIYPYAAGSATRGAEELSPMFFPAPKDHGDRICILCTYLIHAKDLPQSGWSDRGATTVTAMCYADPFSVQATRDSCATVLKHCNFVQRAPPEPTGLGWDLLSKCFGAPAIGMHISDHICSHPSSTPSSTLLLKPKCTNCRKCPTRFLSNFGHTT